MAWSRRLFLSSAMAAPLLSAAPAQAAPACYPMACDPALVPAVREAAALFRIRTGITIFVLPTAPALVVAQLTHQIQNDIVMSHASVVDAADAAGYAVPQAPRPKFRGQRVLATLADAPVTALSEALSNGAIAITDRTPGRPGDDLAILTAMELRPARTIGALDSGEVAFLVASGAAGAGLMLLSDVRSDPSLKVAQEVPETAAAAIVYVVSTTRAPRRPEPESFVSFLAEGDGADILAHYGVERLA